MRNITGIFEDIYIPIKAFLIYEPMSASADNGYVESYDVNDDGSPLNGHPLSIREAEMFAQTLNKSPELQRKFLQPRGLVPENLLYLNNSNNGFAVWYTPAQKVHLFFIDSLGIPSGRCHLPSLVWKAGRNSLYIYALKENRKPTLRTGLHHAPFFNIHQDGKVCMGTVDIDIDNQTMLEDFILSWQNYFFNSYFSHLLGVESPVSTNVVQLWQGLVNRNKKFPVEVLIKNNYTLKHLIQ